MKAVYIEQTGGVEALTYGDLPKPQPAAGEEPGVTPPSEPSRQSAREERRAMRHVRCHVAMSLAPSHLTAMAAMGLLTFFTFEAFEATAAVAVPVGQFWQVLRHCDADIVQHRLHLIGVEVEQRQRCLQVNTV